MTRFVVVLTLVAGSMNAALAQSPLASRLAQLSQDFYAAQKLPGLAVGVLIDSQVVYRAGFGSTRMGGGQPITTGTLFHMASITKPFVATAVVQLSNAGKVDLDAPVTRYVPYFRMKDSRASAITVRQLLTHTAGMPDVTDYRWNYPEYDDQSLERWIRGLADRHSSPRRASDGGTATLRSSCSRTWWQKCLASRSKTTCRSGSSRHSRCERAHC